MTDEPTAEELCRRCRSEIRRVKKYLKTREKSFRIKSLAGFDVKEEAQVRRWLDLLAACLSMCCEVLENGNTRDAEENPRAQGGHRRGRGR